MAVNIDELFTGISYLIVSLVSLNCLQMYYECAGDDASSQTFGLFIVNILYGLAGFLASFTDQFKEIQKIFYVAQMSFIVPFYCSELWEKSNMFPKHKELIYVPLILGLLPVISYLALNIIRIDLIDLSLVYCMIAMTYVGHTVKDFYAVASGLLFYLGYVMYSRSKEKTANFCFVLFNVAALCSISPGCLEKTCIRHNKEFPFAHDHHF